MYIGGWDGDEDENIHAQFCEEEMNKKRVEQRGDFTVECRYCRQSFFFASQVCRRLNRRR